MQLIPNASAWLLILSGLAGGGAAFGWTLRWGFRLIERMQKLRLGWFGERAVADQLEELKSKGYEVFHDVPCLGASGRFNLDHVVVGRPLWFQCGETIRARQAIETAGPNPSFDLWGYVLLQICD